MNEQEENYCSRRVITANRFSPGKAENKNLSITRAERSSDKFSLEHKLDKAISKTIQRKDFNNYVANERPIENKSLSNKSLNSTILENIIGFKRNSEDENPVKREKAVSNNFMLTSNSNVPKSRTAKSKIIGIARNEKSSSPIDKIEEESPYNQSQKISNN